MPGMQASAPVAPVVGPQWGTEGPMARTVKDLAKLLEVQSGYSVNVPLSISSHLKPFVQPSDANTLKGKRIGWLGDLNGYLAMEDGILPVCEQALQRCADAGAIVEPISLGFDTQALWSAWLAWRRALVGPKVAPLLAIPGARDRIKPEALWEHDQAASLNFMDFMKASEVRTAYHTHLLSLFERFDVLALPVAQVWPFPVAQRYLPSAFPPGSMPMESGQLACN